MLPPLLLGSKSPRRVHLLREAGYDFQVETQDVEEVWPSGMPAEQIPAFLAGLKAQALRHRADTHLVITADTAVVLGDRIINKPANEEEAVEMLSQLSGHRHTVVSGVYLQHGQHSRVFSEFTHVYFRRLALEEIRDYVHRYQPLDKAGAYGVQDRIGLIGVSRIEGDYYNVMGLPVCRLSSELHHFAHQLRLEV